MHFGPDGSLYIAVGENANRNNAQTLDNLLGKMLRINADGTIPTDNPFVNQATGDNDAIWALGLRNPFTFAFQPGTGRMFINDVGRGHLGGDQRRHRRLELRLAADRRPDHRCRRSRAAVRVPARSTAHHRLRDHRRRLLQPDARSTSRARSSGSTSSPTSAPAGSACSIPRPEPPPGSRPRWPRPSISRSRTTARSGTCSAAAPRPGRSTASGSRRIRRRRSRAPEQRDRRRRTAGHLHGGRVGQPAAQLSVAARDHEHRGRDQPDAHLHRAAAATTAPRSARS